MKKILFIFLIVFFWCASADAVTYYINSAGAGGGYGAGDDGNAGTQALPWLTIAGSVAKVADGDIVYLHGNFDEALTNGWTGSVTIKADGTVNWINTAGTAPLVLAAAVTENLVFEDIIFTDGPNSTRMIRYACDFAVTFNRCTFNMTGTDNSITNFIVNDGASKTKAITFNSCDILVNEMAGSFISATGTPSTSSYVFTGTATDRGTIHLTCAIADTFYFMSRTGADVVSPLTLNYQDIDFDENIYWGVRNVGANAGGSFTMTNCTMDLKSSSYGFFNCTAGPPMAAITITGNTIRCGQMFAATARPLFGFADTTTNSLVFTDNDISVGEFNGYETGNIYAVLQFASRTNGATAIVSRNVLRHKFNTTTTWYGIALGSDGDDADVDNHLLNPEVSYNEIYDVGYYYPDAVNDAHSIFIGPEDNAIVKHNKIHGGGFSIVLKGKDADAASSSGAKVFGNVCVNNTSSTTARHFTLSCATNALVYNNTTYNDDSNLVYFAYVADSSTSGGVDSTGCEIRNNIMQTNAIAQYVIYDKAGSTMSASNNCYYSAAGTYNFTYDGTGLTLANWLLTNGADAVPLDSNSITAANPKLADPANGLFWIRQGSSCRGAGVDIGTEANWPVLVNEQIIGFYYDTLTAGELTTLVAASDVVVVPNIAATTYADNVTAEDATKKVIMYFDPSLISTSFHDYASLTEEMFAHNASAERITYTGYTPTLYLMDVTNAAYQAYVAAHLVSQMASSANYDGVFLDDMSGLTTGMTLSTALSGTTVPASTDWQTGCTAIAAAVHTALKAVNKQYIIIANDWRPHSHAAYEPYITGHFSELDELYKARYAINGAPNKSYGRFYFVPNWDGYVGTKAFAAGVWDIGAYKFTGADETRVYADSNTDYGSNMYPGTVDLPVATLLAGDNTVDATCRTVSLKDGGTWAETLTVGQSGATGDVVTYNAYPGTGAKPVIDGEDTRNTGITNSGMDFITIDGLEIKETVTNGILVGSGSEDVTIKNCYIHDTTQNGIMVSGGTADNKRCTIQNNTIYHLGLDGTSADITSGSLTGGSRYRIVTFNAGDDFTQVNSVNSTVISGTMNTTGCVFRANSTGAATVYANSSVLKSGGLGNGIILTGAADGATRVEDCTIEYNYIYDLGFDNHDHCVYDQGYQTTVRYNKLFNATGFGHKISSREAGGSDSGAGCVSYGNLIANNDTGGVLIECAHISTDGTHSLSNPKNHRVYNNTIYQNGTADVSSHYYAGLQYNYYEGTPEGNEFKNNIVVAPDVATHKVYFIYADTAANSLTGLTFDNNCYYGSTPQYWRSVSDAAAVDTLANWQAAAYTGTNDNNSISADPRFQSTIAGVEKLWVRAGSPCSSAGVQIPICEQLLETKSVWPDSVTIKLMPANHIPMGAYVNPKKSLFPALPMWMKVWD